MAVYLGSNQVNMRGGQPLGGAEIVTVEVDVQAEDVITSSSIISGDLGFWRLWLDSTSGFPSDSFFLGFEFTGGANVPAMYNTDMGALIVTEAYGAELGLESSGEYTITCYFITGA